MNNQKMQTCNNRCLQTNNPTCYPSMTPYRSVDSTKDMVLAMAFVPWQSFGSVCEPDKALNMGTIFPELYKPFVGCKGGRY